MQFLQQQWMGEHYNLYFVTSVSRTVQVNGAELVFTVIAEEVSIPPFSTKCTYNFSDILLNFECLLDPNVFLYYARICQYQSPEKKQYICTVNRHALFVVCKYLGVDL